MNANPKLPFVEITRIFDAEPNRVFDAWIDRDQWQSWIGPEGIDCDVTLLEPRVGGRYALTMHLRDGTLLPVEGTFRAVDRPKLLAFTWGMAGNERETLVTISLLDLGGRTELTLRHEGIPDADDREGHREGWESALGKLTRYLASAA